LNSIDAVALQTFSGDGVTQKIILGGSLGGNLAVARLNPDGTLDGTFGSNGVATADPSGVSQNNLNDLAVDASNNIVAAGDASNFQIAGAGALAPPAAGTQQAVLVKFAADGTPGA